MKNMQHLRLSSLIPVVAVTVVVPLASKGDHWWDNRPDPIHDYGYYEDLEPVNWFYFIADGGTVISGGEYADRSDRYENPEDAPTEWFGSMPSHLPSWNDHDVFGNPREGDYIRVIGIEDLSSIRDLRFEGSDICLPRSVRYLADGALADYTTDLICWQIYDDDNLNNPIEFDYLGYKPFMRDPYRQGNYVDVLANYVVDAFGTETSLDFSAYKGIAGGALENYSTLLDVSLPATIEIIPKKLCNGCSGLGAIILPATVGEIESLAFGGCTSLTNIMFEGNAPTSVVATAFQGVNSNCVVTVQRGTTGWGEVPGTWQGMPIRYAGEELPPAPVVVDLSTLTGDYTASDGDVLTNSTTYVVTIPAGATVTINGVTVAGGAGSGATGPAVFADGGEAITTRIEPGANGTWMLTAFAELASGSAEGLDDAQVKVYAANSLAGLASAQPMASGVVVTNKAPAVKVELEVTPPANADAQFFRVGFGE